MNAEQFKAAMGLTTDRVVQVSTGAQLGNPSTTLYINFINLPADVHARGLGGGAESENNRQSFRVTFKDGKAKIEQMTNALDMSWLPVQRKSIRAKTATPERVAAYLGAYINETAATVAPRYTHSKP